MTVDVAIIGSGYIGLSAALTLARGGRDVLVMEQASVGWGASSRNFGMLGRQYKRDFVDLLAAWVTPPLDRRSARRSARRPAAGSRYAS